LLSDNQSSPFSPFSSSCVFCRTCTSVFPFPQVLEGVRRVAPSPLKGLSPISRSGRRDFYSPSLIPQSFSSPDEFPLPPSRERRPGRLRSFVSPDFGALQRIFSRCVPSSPLFFPQDLPEVTFLDPLRAGEVSGFSQTSLSRYFLGLFQQPAIPPSSHCA